MYQYSLEGSTFLTDRYLTEIVDIVPGATLVVEDSSANPTFTYSYDWYSGTYVVADDFDRVILNGRDITDSGDVTFETVEFDLVGTQNDPVFLIFGEGRIGHLFQIAGEPIRLDSLDDFYDVAAYTYGASVAGYPYAPGNVIRLDELPAVSISYTAPVGPTGGNDVLSGTAGEDFIRLLGGDDTYRAGAGDDIVRGDAGRDLVFGGRGDDVLDGGADDDRLYGEAGRDLLRGDGGDDTLDGGSYGDRLQGGDGDDLLRGGQGYDVLDGGAGADRLFGGTEADRLFGRDGNDTIHGQSGDDIASGGTGDDVILGGSGNDRLLGDGGNDLLRAGTGDDRMAGNAGDDRMFGDAGRDVMQGGAGDDRLDGGTYGDRLFGDAGRDILIGGRGFDRLDGGAGADTLQGGTEGDLLTGGFGVDRMSGGGLDGQRDRFIFTAAGETGTGYASRDTITDFAAGEDRIELWKIDADTGTAGNQRFDFLGTGAFTGEGGELRLYQFRDSHTIIQADVDGDARADFEIDLLGRVDLDAGDFLL